MPFPHGWRSKVVGTLPGAIRVRRIRSLSLPLGRSLETVGLEALGHPELQVVMDIRTTEVVGILGAAVRAILSGGCFQPLRTYRGVLRGAYEVRCIRAVSLAGTESLRLVLPDSHNRLEADRMHRRHSLQYLGRFPDSSDMPNIPLPPPEEPAILVTADQRDIEALSGRRDGLFGIGCLQWPANDSDFGNWVTVGTPLKRRGAEPGDCRREGYRGAYLGFAWGRPAVGVGTGRRLRWVGRVELFADCVVMRPVWEVDFAALPEKSFPYWLNRKPFWD